MNIAENIYLHLKTKEINIGDFEHSLGVSPGYLSRTRNNGHKPGIDFVVKAADYLNLTLDTLFRIDMKDMNETEKYLLPFIDKLLAWTECDELTWRVDGSRVKTEIMPEKWVSIYCENGVKGLFLETPRENNVKHSELCTVGVICKTDEFPRFREIIDVLDSTARSHTRPPLSKEVLKNIDLFLGSDKKEV